MFIKNTSLDYPLLLLKSIGKKSFTALGAIIEKSGDTIKRLLNSPKEIFLFAEAIAQAMFEKDS